MHRIAGIESHQSLADLACGSGGLLVHKDIEKASGASVGCEISPEWVRIAWANCALHELPNREIVIGNALDICTDKGKLAERSFDRILMNPPFGQAVDPKQARKALGQQASSRSELVLVTLALEKCSEGGCVCALVPSGVLVSTGNVEGELRRRLVDGGQLEVVVRLPKDAFQPFSPLQTYLILERNTPSDENSATWFLYADRDGYASGRSRDLTEPPDIEKSDLPLLEGVIVERQEDEGKRFPEQQPLIHIRTVKKDQQVLGVVISAIDGHGLATVEHFPSQGFVLTSFVDRRTDAEGEQRIWLSVDLDTGEVEETEDLEAYLRTLQEQQHEATDGEGEDAVLEEETEEDEFANAILHSEEEEAHSIAIAADGRLVGTLVPRRRIHDTGYDLRPDRYLQLEVRKREPEAPAALLGRIRGNQRQLLDRIDDLLSRLDVSPIGSTQLPPPVWEDDDAKPQPFGALSEKQRSIWNEVSQKIEEDEQGNYETPVHFTEADLDAAEDRSLSTDATLTMDLLTRMGLVRLTKLIRTLVGLRQF